LPDKLRGIGSGTKVLGDIDMVKYAAFVRKQPQMSREDFEANWLGGHASIVKRFPNLRRYTITFLQEGSEVGWDGYAELWFDSEEDLQTALECDLWAVEAAADRGHWMGHHISDPVKAEHRII
jgi:uncharacterized protein (TIGR02118 family)